jgi:DNA-directed RNA polymerase specialized sigma24 family protein
VPERLSAPRLPDTLLPGLEQWVVQTTLQTWLTNTSPESLSDPREYLKRLQSIPQLPAPRLAPETPALSARQTASVQPTALVQEREPITRSENAEPTFTTCFGIVPFETLYHRTRRYAAYVLHHTYHLQEVDDGLQAGYLALWQRLSQTPDLLQGKSLAWIGRFIAHAALHAARYERQASRHAGGQKGKQKAKEDGEYFVWSAVGYTPHSRETRQIDTRIDLHKAVKTVAEAILYQPSNKRQDYELWALYGMAMLHVYVTECAHIFNVRFRAMQKAYEQVRDQLQAQLPEYAPKGNVKRSHGRGQKRLPYQDIRAIRKTNTDIPETIFETVKADLLTTQSDTLAQDLIALEGIRQGITAQAQGRANGLKPAQIQQAYTRVHLLIGAQRDAQIRARRPTHRTLRSFELTSTTETSVEQLANELLSCPKSYEKLVALYAVIGNLKISTTAQHFFIPTSTLRYYALRIWERLSSSLLD